MKKLLRLFVIFVFIVLAVSNALLFLHSQNLQSQVDEFNLSKFQKLSFVQNPPKNLEKTDKENIDAIQKQPKSENELFMTGWIPDWDFGDGFNTLKNHSGDFGSISPFWYELNEDGTLKQTVPSEDPEFSSYIKNSNITFIPTITNFDADIFTQMLNSEENRTRHIDEIVRIVQENNYDGIDLDYESTYLTDKELFFDFLQKLSVKMNQIEKQLIFTVMPKWGDKDVIYPGLQETRRVQDYKRIADLVDEFRIMTYEYTGRNSIFYGPNAPLEWMEDVIKYAISEGVPRDKIVMGIPTYSYDYSIREILGSISFYPTLKIPTEPPLGPAAAYYNTTVDDIKNNYEYTEEFNKEWGEMVLKYTFEGTPRVVVYPTSESINLRKKLAAEYGIKGVAFWRLGDEGELQLTN